MGERIQNPLVPRTPTTKYELESDVEDCSFTLHTPVLKARVKARPGMARAMFVIIPNQFIQARLLYVVTV